VPLQTALARCLSREPRLQDLPPSYTAVACCAVAPCQPTVVLLCRACAAGVELFVAGVDGRRGRSLARLCAASSSAALVGRPVPAGDYPLLNPSRLQLLSGGQSALRAGIKLCGHLCSPSLRTRTAAILVGVLVHAAPLPRTSARLRPSSYTLHFRLQQYTIAVAVAALPTLNRRISRLPLSDST